jgi:hypothetical protein
MLPTNIPNPMGTRSNGSNSNRIPRKMKTNPIRIMIIWPHVTLAKPVYMRNCTIWVDKKSMKPPDANKLNIVYNIILNRGLREARP